MILSRVFNFSRQQILIACLNRRAMSEELAIKRFNLRANEDIEKKRSRLLYQSKKRGILENGVILASFARKFLPYFDANQLDQYDRLINLPTNDWDIFYWATKTKPTPPEYETPVMDKLREHLNSKVSNGKFKVDSVLGKTRPDDIVLPAKKRLYDLDITPSDIDLSNYKTELFDDRKTTLGSAYSMVNMTEWRKRFFEKRLRRTISAPPSLVGLNKPSDGKVYSLRIANKTIASQSITPKNLIDSKKDRYLKHHNFLQHLMSSKFTDEPSDYDDEAEAWADMVWHRNYGSCDDKVTPSRSHKCSICSSSLHCCDSALKGYVPKEIFVGLKLNENTDHMCQLCRFTTTYGAHINHNVDKETYLEFLGGLRHSPKSIICLLVDLTDLPGSIWEGFIDLIGGHHRVIVVGNKLDLLPHDGGNFLTRVRWSLKQNISRLRPNNRDLSIDGLTILSAKTGFGIDALITRILKFWETPMDVYLVGCDNTGKSTLLNALLQSDLCAIRKGDILSRVSAYKCPAVDVNLLKFPINEFEGWEVEHKRKKTLMAERDQKRQEASLGARSRRLQENAAHMSLLIDRLDYGKIERESSTNGPDDDSLERRLTHGEKPQDVVPNFSEDHPLHQFTEGEPLSATEHKYKLNKFLHMTPSICNDDQIHDLLTNDERLEVFPNETILPRRFTLRPMQSIFIAGLARIDLLTAQSTVMFTVFVSKYLPIHVIPTHKADHFYNNFLGSPYLGVPFGSDVRMATWPGLEGNVDHHIKGVEKNDGAADIVLSSIGWAMISPGVDQECIVRALTPGGIGIFCRQVPLLKYANKNYSRKIRDTPIFRHPGFIVEEDGRIEEALKHR